MEERKVHEKLNGFHFMFQNSNISKSIIRLFARVLKTRPRESEQMPVGQEARTVSLLSFRRPLTSLRHGLVDLPGPSPRFRD